MGNTNNACSQCKCITGVTLEEMQCYHLACHKCIDKTIDMGFPIRLYPCAACHQKTLLTESYQRLVNDAEKQEDLRLMLLTIKNFENDCSIVKQVRYHFESFSNKHLRSRYRGHHHKITEILDDPEMVKMKELTTHNKDFKEKYDLLIQEYCEYVNKENNSKPYKKEGKKTPTVKEALQR